MAEGAVTPNGRFYIRSHFPVPEIDAERWRLQVRGLVKEPQSLSLSELTGMRARTIPVTLECAGNGRSMFDPPIEGEPWALGAVSTAEWTGVPLFEVLNRAGVESTARHLVLRSADSFERGISLEDAREVPLLLAYAMNGEPLPAQHGYPLRAIVPAWYAVASVKWLTEIEVTEQPFDGYFQTQRYMYEWPGGRAPVKYQKVRSLITSPEDGETIPTGELTIRGLAWSGGHPVGQVHVSIDHGDWVQARLLDLPARYAWRSWELATSIDQVGEVVISSRATDVSRETQPEEADWNRLGYGNNSIQRVAVTVR